MSTYSFTHIMNEYGALEIWEDLQTLCVLSENCCTPLENVAFLRECKSLMSKCKVFGGNTKGLGANTSSWGNAKAFKCFFLAYTFFSHHHVLCTNITYCVAQTLKYSKGSYQGMRELIKCVSYHECNVICFG